jgi:hypothetical protein
MADPLIASLHDLVNQIQEQNVRQDQAQQDQAASRATLEGLITQLTNVSTAHQIRQVRTNQAHAARQQALENVVEQLANNFRPGEDLIPKFNGRPDDDVDEWLLRVNNTAESVGWEPDEKRRVAVRHLGEAALEWHQRAGGLLATWDAWSEGLRGAFQPKLSLPEWCTLVESRVQRPGEAGVRYVLDKVKLCGRCPIPLPEQEVVNHLIRGLASPEIKAALMRPTPNNVNAFIAALSALEAVNGTTAPNYPVASAAVAPQPSSSDLLLKTMADTLVMILQKVTITQQAPYRPAQGGPRPPPAYYNAPGPRDYSRVECHGCRQLGHIRRDCPQEREQRYDWAPPRTQVPSNRTVTWAPPPQNWRQPANPSGNPFVEENAVALPSENYMAAQRGRP